MKEEDIIQIENLNVHFDVYEGTAKVINGVDLSIGKEEAQALVGETGCGKSVTAKSIMGLLPPPASIKEGRILFKGEDLLTLPEEERHRKRGLEMNMIMQDPMTSLSPVHTIREQMLDVLKWQGKKNYGILQWIKSRFDDNEEYEEKALDMLSKVDISAPRRVLSSYPVELSAGMRQRVLIAISLLSRPEFLIADEPGTALDTTTQSKVLDLLEELKMEMSTSVLYITHDLGVARRVSERINVMYAGEIVESSPTEKLFDSPKHPYTRGLLESIPRLTGKIGKGIKGQLPDYTNPPPACRFFDRCPFSEEVCNRVFPYPRWVDSDSKVACHLYDGAPVFERHKKLSGEEIELDEKKEKERVK